MNGIFTDLKQWLLETAKAFRDEFRVVFHDVGVLIFFIFLPIAYPIIYSLIYNPEVTRDMPVAVVDHSRSSLSREFVRHADATEAMQICGYAKDLQEARRWMDEKKCFAIIEIPADYASKLGRAEQPQIQFYAEMSLLLRYRTFTSSITELQIATGADLRTMTLSDLGIPAAAMSGSSAIDSVGFALGDTQQGFASFIIPGIVVLILQQSMVLGIVMLGGTRREKRRSLAGLLAGSGSQSAPLGDPREAANDPLLRCDDYSPSALVIGRALCYTVIYLPLTIYILHFVIYIFNYPMEGSLLQELLFIFPMLLATAMFAQTLNIMASERESTFIIVVFTSVAFLFLSGLTWPRYAMGPVTTMIGNLIPATWGLEGFVRINSNGATLAQQLHPWLWLWGLTLLYTLTAWLTARHQRP